VNFDPKCLTCHGGIKGAAGKFTDHRIRVVKPNEPYPG
jgi:hypothetical protein